MNLIKDLNGCTSFFGPGEVSKTLNIENIKDTILYVLVPLESLTLKNITKSYIWLGPAKRSVTIIDCASTVFGVTCQQIRIHCCTNLKIWLSVTTSPLMEDSEHITFDISSKDPNYYNLYSEHLTYSNLQSAHFLTYETFSVSDFNWLKAIPSPFWKLSTIKSKPYSIKIASNNEKTVEQGTVIMSQMSMWKITL
ncbi:uncharacterized protein CMU_017470 [Cryptosporidium muris RN66]|uniref:C-CAP/cofactor C-like domain-containing protein n=1 Tax=Cryptosporidium muris (strain RN66) TaxID=441375 RepID=B6ACZ0_CRYMR|nr:uncharacterized protein CMU_017470 [Cryptosporidium muris RN66]EEA05994.1 hypothetical protein, conserved [Cryptosporidium muris RN66]|eukprot:XP_002140343.1 hypothetical protein [Cryptosporidium muris RN66]